MDYLAWRECLVTLAVEWWWSCGWRRLQVMLALAVGKKLVAEGNKFVAATLLVGERIG